MKKLVLTGGPCAGKTTAINYLREKLESIGLSVIFVPEVATTLINAGLNPGKLDRAGFLAFQELILETQLQLEEICEKALAIKGGERQVMICDRGCMDNVAYIGWETFRELIGAKGWKEVDLCDKRYDGVFHLVTAAKGKEEYYNLDNPARTETLEQARELDTKTQEAWIGSPHLVVIDNTTDFEEKMKRLLNAVRKALGIPVAIETERKFLVHQRLDLSKIPVPYQKIKIEQFYIRDQSGQKMRVRARSRENAGTVYYRTIKLDTGSAMSRVEIEEQISELDYYRSLADKRPNHDPIRKDRVCFLWKNQYFELDMFIDPERHRGLTLLEVELTKENDRVAIPEWLGQVTEVTEDPQYLNAKLSKKPK